MTSKLTPKSHSNHEKGVQEASKTTQVDQEMPKDRPSGIQETPGSIYSSFKGVLRRQGGEHVPGLPGPECQREDKGGLSYHPPLLKNN